METPQKFHLKDNHCIKNSSFRSKAAVVTKTCVSPRNKSLRFNSRSEEHIFFQSFLPWPMVSSKKLFDTLTISNQSLLYHDLALDVVTGSASHAHLRTWEIKWGKQGVICAMLSVLTITKWKRRKMLFSQTRTTQHPPNSVGWNNGNACKAHIPYFT